jgi:hypothetical protein
VDHEHELARRLREPDQERGEDRPARKQRLGAADDGAVFKKPRRVEQAEQAYEARDVARGGGFGSFEREPRGRDALREERQQSRRVARERARRDVHARDARRVEHRRDAAERPARAEHARAEIREEV